MPLELVTASTDEPVNVPEVAEYLRIDDEDTDENILRRMIIAARQQIEQVTNRVLLTQTWDWKVQGWWRGSKLLIPKAPLASITSIKYLDSAGTEQTWAASNYIVDTPSGEAAVKGAVALADGITFPVLDDVINPVTIRFVAGYGTKYDVPEAIRIALMMMVGDMYENRQSYVIGTSASTLPQTARTLLQPFRVMEFA